MHDLMFTSTLPPFIIGCLYIIILYIITFQNNFSLSDKHTFNSY